MPSKDKELVAEAQEIIGMIQEAAVAVSGSYTNEELLAKLIAHIDKISLKGLLKSFCLIDRQEEETIYFVVLQKLQLSMMQKPDNVKTIEDSLSAILQRTVKVSMKYQSKDEYFSSLL